LRLNTRLITQKLQQRPTSTRITQVRRHKLTTIAKFPVYWSSRNLFSYLQEAIGTEPVSPHYESFVRSRRFLFCIIKPINYSDCRRTLCNRSDRKLESEQFLRSTCDLRIIHSFSLRDRCFRSQIHYSKITCVQLFVNLAPVLPGSTRHS
jgi:hypothetical protein